MTDPIEYFELFLLTMEPDNQIKMLSRYFLTKHIQTNIDWVFQSTDKKGNNILHTTAGAFADAFFA